MGNELVSFICCDVDIVLCVMSKLLVYLIGCCVGFVCVVLYVVCGSCICYW